MLVMLLSDAGTQTNEMTLLFTSRFLFYINKTFVEGLR
jgi:flagellar biosynthesis protein FliQ